MGGFWSGIFGRRPSPKILLLGLDAAGKTTILKYLKHGGKTKAKATEPTIGFNVETVKWNKIELSVWDVGGQDKLRNFWRHYYTGCSCIIFVVDANDHARYKQAKEELLNLSREITLREVPVLLLANKQDLPEARSTGQIAKFFELDKLNRETKVLGCVATEGEGVHDAMTWVSKNMRIY